MVVEVMMDSGRGRGERQSQGLDISKAEPTGLADRLDVGCEIKREGQG